MKTAPKNSVPVEVHNETNYPTDEIAGFVEFCSPPGITSSFSVVIKQTDQPGHWDAETDIEKREVTIILPPESEFPQVFDVNHELPGGYLRKSTLFENIWEFLIFYLGHEIFHLRVLEKEPPLIIQSQIARFWEWDEETLCDVAALAILSRFRRQQENF